MKMQPDMQASSASVLYRGHALSEAEMLALRPNSSLSRGALTLILSGWVALVIFLMMPVMAVATIAGTPMVSAIMDRMQRA